ncbi:hypothetical protein niasHT_017745 [Heterodera trifolii]|uniref:G-protein coupled receptors family 1 profile domain-containing protein n=1 Tax=Heterodera trifolii TaxID=157864 RepID=A0ABD2LJC2_9BILA
MQQQRIPLTKLAFRFLHGLQEFSGNKKQYLGVELSAKTYLFICLLYVSTITVSFIVSAIIYCIARNSTRIRSTAYGTRSETPVQTAVLRVLQHRVDIRHLSTVPITVPWHHISVLSRPPPLIGLLINISYYLLVIGIVVNPLMTIVTQRLRKQINFF